MKKIFNVLGLVGSLYALIFVSLSTLFSHNFSWVNNYLSDIGAGLFGTFPQFLFNSTLIIGGIILAIFFILKEIETKDIISKISLIIMIIGSISFSLIGVFTEHSPYNLHLIFSYGFFLLFPLAMVIMSIHYFKAKLYFGLTTLLMGILALGIILDLPLGNGKAIPEMGEAIVLSIWIIIFSIFKYKFNE